MKGKQVLFLIIHTVLLIVKSNLVDDIEQKEIYVKKQLSCETWVFRNGQRDYRGDGRMVVGFTITYAISSAYHHGRCHFESHSDEMYSIQHYVVVDRNYSTI